jgi:hypothetical protein
LFAQNEGVLQCIDHAYSSKAAGVLSAQRKSSPSTGNNGTLSETSLPVWRSEHSLSAQSRADELSDGATRRRCLYAKSLHQPEAGSQEPRGGGQLVP